MIICIGVSNVTGIQYLVPVGKQKQYTISVVIGSIVNLILNSMLISKLQSYGAAIASVCAELTVTVVQLIIVRKHIPVKSILKQSVKYVVAGLIMLISISIIENYMRTSIRSTIFLVAVGVLIYSVILFFEKDDMIKEFLCNKKH